MLVIALRNLKSNLIRLIYSDSKLFNYFNELCLSF